MASRHIIEFWIRFGESFKKQLILNPFGLCIVSSNGTKRNTWFLIKFDEIWKKKVDFEVIWALYSKLKWHQVKSMIFSWNLMKVNEIWTKKLNFGWFWLYIVSPNGIRQNRWNFIKIHQIWTKNLISRSFGLRIVSLNGTKRNRWFFDENWAKSLIWSIYIYANHTPQKVTHDQWKYWKIAYFLHVFWKLKGINISYVNYI